MSKWISIRDELPDGNGCYVVCWRDERGVWKAGLARFAYSNISGEFKSEKPEPVFFGFDWQNHVQQYEKPEYWMPLPEPPKESEVEREKDD